MNGHSSQPVKMDYSKFESYESKHRARSGIKVLRPYMSRPGMISFGGGYPHASTWPVNGMTLSVPFAERSVFVPGYQNPTPDGLLPLEPYTPPLKGEALSPDLTSELQYSSTFGQAHFTAWWKEHVSRIHDPPYEDWIVHNTAGNTDAVDAILRTCVDRGDCILVEEFAYPGLLTHCESLGMPPIGIPMDQNGIQPDALEATLTDWEKNRPGVPRPKFLIIVATCSNPTGATTTESRKKEIYQICRNFDLMIVEDDPYYFLQTRSKDPRSPFSKSFLSMDVDGRVLRLDSFSKIVAPGSRCGFLTGPTELVTKIMYSRECSTQCPSGFSVAAISAVLRAWGSHKGFESQYLPYISDVYVKRAILMCNLITEHVPSKAATAPPPSGGMFLWLRLHIESHPDFPAKSPEEIAEQVFQSLIEANVLTVPSKFFKAPGPKWSKEEEAHRIFLRLCFANPTEEDIIKGVKNMGHALKEEWKL